MGENLYFIYWSDHDINLNRKFRYPTLKNEKFSKIRSCSHDNGSLHSDFERMLR